jgi:hypothetical protein
MSSITQRHLVSASGLDLAFALPTHRRDSGDIGPEVFCGKSSYGITTPEVAHSRLEHQVQATNWPVHRHMWPTLQAGKYLGT